MKRNLPGFWLGALLVFSTVGVFAATTGELAERTVVLVNARSPDSMALGRFYAEQRAIPSANVIALPMPESEAITWREFVDQVWQPLQDELMRRDWIQGISSDKLDAHGRRRIAVTGHRIAYLVACRGTPLKIHHDPIAFDEAQLERIPTQFRTSQSAVDSELSLLAQPAYSLLGFQRNALFQASATAELGDQWVVKVSRLDGPSADDARRLVTSAMAGERQGLVGRYYVDKSGPHADGDVWLEAVRAQLNGLGYSGDVHEGPGQFEAHDRFDAPVLYFGWYAGGVNGPFLRDQFRFPPGAIALHIHSFSASTVRSATSGWSGPLVARGAAATFGNVFEPYLQLSLRPDLLMQQLAAGATLGDAAYFATPVLSWQGVVLGDPLYRPFAKTLDAQMADLAKLPVTLAAHVIDRRANLHEQVEEKDAADALLKRASREFPSVSLILIAARRAQMAGDVPRTLAALAPLARLPRVSAEEWGAIRGAAEWIAANASAREALPYYRLLAASSAPTRDAQLKLLHEARRAADAAGDLTQSLDYARRINEFTASLAPSSASRKR